MIWSCLILQSLIHLMLYWGIFPFRLRFINLHGVAWSSPFTRYMSSWWSILFYDDSLVEPLLSHSVKLILFDIVVILWWSYLRRINSHIIISMEYISDLLCIPIKLFLSHQDRSDLLVAILGHTFLGYLHSKMHQLLYWGIFLIFMLSRWLISHLAFIVFFAGPSFDDFF